MADLIIFKTNSPQRKLLFSNLLNDYGYKVAPHCFLLKVISRDDIMEMIACMLELMDSQSDSARLVTLQNDQAVTKRVFGALG